MAPTRRPGPGWALLSLLALLPTPPGTAQSPPRPSLFPPVLKVRSREGFLPENAPVGTTVRVGPSMSAESLQILVEDQDLTPGMMPAIYQYVINGFGAEKFAVDQRGFLYLNSADGLDADSNSSSFQLHIQAREVDTEPLRSSESIAVTIHVLDQNDNAPVFEQPVYLANVSADQAQERFVARVRASDADSGAFGRLAYRLAEVSDGAEASFRFDPASRTLTAVGRLLPHHRYRILLEARDGGGLLGRAVVLVYALPSAPGPPAPAPAHPLLPLARLAPPVQAAPAAPASSHVQTIVTELSEATPPHSIVAVLGDEQSRAQVYFLIVEGNEANKFAVNSDTGAVVTTQEFDREETDLYTLQIEARSKIPDQSLYWTLLQVAVTDVNDNAPEFDAKQALSFRLDLGAAARGDGALVVGRVRATDADKDENGRVAYRILPPKDRLFSIDPNGMISVRGRPGSEHLGEHDLLVLAADHGVPPLESTVRVKVVVEGAPPHSDEYDETEEFGQGPLMFSRATLPPLASTEQPPATWTSSAVVSARPEHRPSPAPRPQSAASASLPSTTSAPKRKAAVSKAQAQSSSPSSPSPAPTSTHTSPRTSPAPPPAPTPSPSSGTEPSPSTGPSRLAPVFAAPAVSVLVEENDGELELATLEAHYPDGQPGPVTFELLEGDAELFAVSSFTGKLTLLKPLDAEANEDYRLVVSTREARLLPRDPLLSHSAVVSVRVVDVNDWIPNFETNTYAFTVSDRTEPGTVIGQVSAFDQDRDEPNNRIHYSVLPEAGQPAFLSINAESGLLTLSRPAKELRDQTLHVTVQAEDEGDPPQTTLARVAVTVEASEAQVIPQGDGLSKPKPGSVQFSQRNFTASLLESVRAPHFVLLLPVLNKPRDARFSVCSIVSGNYRQAFGVSAGPDGNCELRTQNPLDRETIERYLLNLTVSADGQSDHALVSVTVLDVNDNRPVFALPSGQKAFHAGVASNAAAFSRVLTVHADDADLGAAGLVQYDLDASAPDSKFFQVDRATGEVILKQSMLQLTQNNKKTAFELRVSACDSPPSGQSLCQTAELFVTAVSDQHRFVTSLKGAQPQQDMVKALKQFTGACSLVVLERMEERQGDKQAFVDLFWFAQNPDTHKICRKQEFRKLFDKSSADLLTGKLQPWFSLARLSDSVSTEPAPLSVLGFWSGLDWNGATLVCAALALAVILAGMLATCAVCLYWQRKKHRHRHVHTYPNVYPLPKYSAAMFMGNNTLDRDKIYETQMLEMPMSDEDFATLKQSSLHSEPRLSNAHFRPFRAQPEPQPPYARSHPLRKFQDDADFTMEESMYAVHAPSRFDCPK